MLAFALGKLQLMFSFLIFLANIVAKRSPINKQKFFSQCKLKGFLPFPSFLISNGYFRNTQSSWRDQNQTTSLININSYFNCVCMYIYILKHIKNQMHGIAWSYADSFDCLFYLLYFYFERKIGFGAVSI